jgi:hypothetical protein
MIFALKNPWIGEKDQHKRLNEREANTESLPGQHNHIKANISFFLRHSKQKYICFES